MFVVCFFISLYVCCCCLVFVFYSFLCVCYICWRAQAHTICMEWRDGEWGSFGWIWMDLGGFGLDWMDLDGFRCREQANHSIVFILFVMSFIYVVLFVRHAPLFFVQLFSLSLHFVLFHVFTCVFLIQFCQFSFWCLIQFVLFLYLCFYIVLCMCVSTCFCLLVSFLLCLKNTKANHSYFYGCCRVHFVCGVLCVFLIISIFLLVSILFFLVLFKIVYLVVCVGAFVSPCWCFSCCFFKKQIHVLCFICLVSLFIYMYFVVLVCFFCFLVLVFVC